MKMPFMTNRDCVFAGDMFWQDDGSLLCLAQTIKHDKYPETKANVRMDMLKLSHFKQEGGDVSAQEFTYMDFKGYFPVKMINLMVSATASKGIEEFAKRVKAASKD